MVEMVGELNSPTDYYSTCTFGSWCRNFSSQVTVHVDYSLGGLHTFDDLDSSFTVGSSAPLQ